MNNNRVAIAYLIATALYFGLGTGHALWAGFNMATLLLAITYFAGSRDRITHWVRLAKAVTLGRLIYTLVCIIWPYEIIYPTNKILSVILLVVIANRWITHSRT